MDYPRAIGYEIKTLSHLIRRSFEKGVITSGLEGVTGMQGWVIGYLYQHESTQEIFQRDIEREFNIRRSTVTGILQLMERNGLITRESVESDSRLKKLKLTPEAVKMHEMISQKIMESEKKMRKGLSEEQIAEFFVIVDIIKNNIE